jgi:hypothetical protein
MIKSLQAGRALAALAVAASHAALAVTDFFGMMPSIIGTPLKYGYLGVDFFFVLSGFLIYYTNHDNLDRPDWGGLRRKSHYPHICSLSSHWRMHSGGLPCGPTLRRGSTRMGVAPHLDAGASWITCPDRGMDPPT